MSLDISKQFILQTVSKAKRKQIQLLVIDIPYCYVRASSYSVAKNAH